MGVPTVITDLSTTAASNSPAGGDSIGTSLDDYLRIIQVFERQLFDTATIYSSTVGGTADVVTLTPTPALTAHKAGQALAWIQSGANTTNVTINPSGIGAKAVTKNGTTALAAGDLPAGGLIVARYDGTQYQLESASIASSTNPFSDASALIKNSSDATKKVIISAASVTTGTTRTLTAPDANTTIVGTDTAQTLTNKTMTDSTTFIADDGDATKKIAFQVSSITTGTTRTYTAPDASGILALNNGYAQFQDQKSSGTSGGTFTSGSFATRTINSTVTNGITGCSLSSNQITLAAGTYYLRAKCAAQKVNRHVARWRNTTDSSTTLASTSHEADTATGQNDYASIEGQFTIAGTKVFELQHQCQTTASTSGYGDAANLGVTEIFSDVQIWKVL